MVVGELRVFNEVAVFTTTCAAQQSALRRQKTAVECFQDDEWPAPRCAARNSSSRRAECVPCVKFVFDDGVDGSKDISVDRAADGEPSRRGSPAGSRTPAQNVRRASN